MDILNLAIGDVFHHLTAWAILYARIAPTFMLIPILSKKIVPHAATRQLLILFIVIAVAPSIPWLASGPAGWELAAQCVAEATTGLAIGMVLALPFWTASFVGKLIDNLRGETLAASIDPASGEQAAILAPFSSLMFANVFLQKGGLTVLVRFFVDIFVAVPPGSVAQLNYVGIAKLLNRTMEVALSLVAPVILALLLTDTVLAFLSRFCKQLNVFSLSLTLKSVAAYGVLYFYFSSEIPYRLYDMVHDYSLRTVFN